MTTSFTQLGVPASLTAVLAALSITDPTPIQAATLPDSLAGRDVLGRGRTGSGKTFAFLLPLVARLAERGAPASPHKPSAIILAPTRELVNQITASLEPLAAAAGLSAVTVFGGVSQRGQVQALKRGAHIVIACPGRLLDLAEQGLIRFDNVSMTILDEADHMADLGFLPSVRAILDRTPRQAQRLLFSATLDRGVKVLVDRYLTNPVTHEADSAHSPVASMQHHVLHISAADRLAVIADLASAPGRTVVFTRTKHGAKKLARQLNQHGIPTVEMHGNLAQNARTRNLDAFHAGQATTLVATDIAARGIHVDDVSLVIHADPPAEHKAYLHRSGRTARAGAEGTVITLASQEQLREVRDLMRAASVTAATTKARLGHPVLHELAPGERVLTPGGLTLSTPQQEQGTGRSYGRGGARGGSGRGGAGRGGAGGRSGTASGSSAGGGARKRTAPRRASGQGGGGAAAGRRDAVSGGQRRR